MRVKTSAYLTLGLAMAVPALVPALDLTFLDQAPIRFMSDGDIDRMEATVLEALDDAADGESRDWQGEESGHSGTVTAVRSFTEKDLACRRVEIVNRVPEAALGSATSMLDLCKIGDDWRILRKRP